jgi:ribosomal-protein-alanine N-acetyltransferase
LTGKTDNGEVRLETDRLVLSPWLSSDWPALRPIATDPEVMRYITGGIPWTDEQIRRFVEGQVRLYAERGFCRWKVLSKAEEGLVGFCGAGFWRDHPDPEIGWWLARRMWGSGHATEAARAALGDAFGRVGLDRLVSIARPENRASIRIMEKLGLRPDGTLESDGVALVRYALDRQGYAGVAGGTVA